jgi:hypothetical protein
MAAFGKFNIFVQNLGLAVYDFTNHTVKCMLVTTAPVATNQVKADIVANEVANGNGYTTGGYTVTKTWTNSPPTSTLACTTFNWTASGAGFGPFRYVAMYDDTPSSPADPLIGFWDYGSSIPTVNSGETFTVTFGAATLTITQ